MEYHPATTCCGWVVSLDTDAEVAVKTESGNNVVVVLRILSHCLVSGSHGVREPVAANIAPAVSTGRLLCVHGLADAVNRYLIVASEDPGRSLLVASLPVCNCCLGRTRTHEGLDFELVSTLLDTLEVLIDLEVALVNLCKTSVSSTTCTRCLTLYSPAIEALLLSRALVLNVTNIEPWVNDELGNIVTRLSLILESSVCLSLYFCDECVDSLGRSCWVGNDGITFIPLILEVKTLLEAPIFEFSFQCLKSNVCCGVSLQSCNVLQSLCVDGEGLLLGSSVLCCCDVSFYCLLVLWAIDGLCKLVVEDFGIACCDVLI